MVTLQFPLAKDKKVKVLLYNKKITELEFI